MAGLVPAIHGFLVKRHQDVDARHKAGHDESVLAGAAFTKIGQRLTAGDILAAQAFAQT